MSVEELYTVTTLHEYDSKGVNVLIVAITGIVFQSIAALAFLAGVRSNVLSGWVGVVPYSLVAVKLFKRVMIVRNWLSTSSVLTLISWALILISYSLAVKASKRDVIRFVCII